MRLLKVALGAALLSLSSPGFVAAAPSFPERDRAAVVDAANVIPDDVESDLNGQIVAWNRATGHQLAVATVPSLQGLQIQDYGTRLLRHWRLGRAEANDGAILLLAPRERQVRIEVGYGLEPVLTDARTSAIIRETIRPALAANDVAGALTAGAKRIMQEAATDPAEAARLAAISKAGPRQADPPFPLGFFLVIGAVIGGIVLLVWRRRGRRRRISPEERHNRRYATVPRAEHRAAQKAGGGRRQGRSHGTAEAVYTSSSDPLMALQERARSSDSHSSSYDSSSSSSSWDSSSSSSSSFSSDSGFDSGGGSGGGGGSDSSY